MKTGSNTTTDREFIAECFRGHMDNINRLAEEGTLIVAGPLGKNENNYRGIFILDKINSIDDAKELLQTDPALATGQWVSLDVPLSSFAGLTTRGHLAQMIISGDPNTVYVDNIYFYRTVTSVDESIIPATFALKQNFPNPFNPETTIQFELPMANTVKLTVYNMLGKEMYTLLNEYKEAGIYTVKLNASELPSGTYFYAITAGEYREVRKMVLIK